MKECIVILGMHRSGTSVLSGLVSLQGFYLGSDAMPPREDNPKGFFENMKVYGLNQSILEAYDTSWDDYYFTTDQIKPDDYHQYLLTAKEIIKEEFGPVNRVFIKDPRMCILFPLWDQALTEMGFKIKIILAYRSPMEVAHSLKSRNQMPIEKSLLMWSHYFFQAEKSSREYERMVVHYANDFQDMDSFFLSLGGFLGIETNEEMLAGAYELYTPQLKHHQLQMDNISDDLPLYLKNFLGILGNGNLDNFSELDEIIDEFYNSQNLYLYNDSKQTKKIKELEIELINSQDELNCQTNDLKQIIGENHKEIEEKNLKIRAIQNAIDSLERQLRENIDLLQKERKLKNTEIKKRTDQIRIGDEIFHTVFESKVWKKKFSRILKDSKYFKTKRALLPFAKQSNKRFLEDKIKIIESGLFSSFYYLTHHPEAWKQKVDPLNFYNKHGWKAGHNPGPNFNTRDYLSMYEDVAQSGVNPLLHYIEYGRKEGRFPKLPSLNIDTDHFNDAGFIGRGKLSTSYRGPTKGEILSIEDKIVKGWLLTETANCMPIVTVDNYPTSCLAYNIDYLDEGMSEPQPGVFKSKLLKSVEGDVNVELLMLSEEGILILDKKTIKNNTLVTNKFTDLERAYKISNEPGAVAITVWEGAHNPIGRAKVLYDIVSSKRPAVIFAYVFGDFGHELWAPLRNSGVPIVLIPYSERFSYQSYIKEKNINFDTVWICKHRLHSFELASFIVRENSACIVDIDDNEDVFVSSKGSETKPYGIFSKNKANYYLSKIKSRSVASVSIQGQFGGKLVRHARKPYSFNQSNETKSETKTLVFIGTIRPHKNVTELVDRVKAFNLSRSEKIKLAIGGDFNPPTLSQTLNTPDTIILGEVPSDDLYNTLDEFDVIITGYPDKSSESSDINKLQITSKIGDGLAIGKPVLTPYSPSVTDLDGVNGLFIFNKDDFDQKLEAALNYEGEINLPDEFTISYSYETFEKLEESAQRDSIARDIFELEPLYDDRMRPQTGQNNIVLIWKQHDSGVYGRRIDHLARYYKLKHPESNVSVVEIIGEDSLSDLDDVSATFDNSSVIHNDVLSKKIHSYDLDGINYHLLTFKNDVNDLNSLGKKFNTFLSNGNIYPDNSVIVLFPLIEKSNVLLESLVGYRIIVDIVDNQVQWMKKPEVRLNGLKQYLELITFADEIVSNSPTNLEYFENLNFFKNKKPHFIANWYSIPSGLQYERDVNKSEINLVYSGNLNDRIDWNLMGKICKVLAELNGNLHVAGSAARRPDQLKRLLRNENCIYHGVIGEKNLLRLLQHVNFAVVPHKEDHISKFMDPIKLKMYKKLGITSLTTRLPSLPDNDPMIIVADSTKDFLDKLASMLESHSYNNKNHEKTNTDSVGDKYVQLIDRLIS